MDTTKAMKRTILQLLNFTFNVFISAIFFKISFPNVTNECNTTNEFGLDPR